MNRSQRVRKGFLSDDEVMRRCPTAFSQAGGRTYGLLKIQGAPNDLAQRPQRADQMINRISKQSGVPVNRVESQYVKSIKSIAINPVVVVSSPIAIPALPVAPTGMPTSSRPYSRAATPLEAPAFLALTNDDLRDIDDDARPQVIMPRDAPKLHVAAPPIASPFISMATLGDNVAKMPNKIEVGLVASAWKDQVAARMLEQRRQQEYFMSTLSGQSNQMLEIYKQRAAEQVEEAGGEKLTVAPGYLEDRGFNAERRRQANEDEQDRRDGTGPYGGIPNEPEKLTKAEMRERGLNNAQIIKEEAKRLRQLDKDDRDFQRGYNDQMREANEQDLREQAGSSTMTKKEGKQPVPFGRRGNYTVGPDVTSTRTTIKVYTQGGREQSISSVSEKIGGAMNTQIDEASSSNLETLD
jgi:hypothetical protein